MIADKRLQLLLVRHDNIFLNFLTLLKLMKLITQKITRVQSNSKRLNIFIHGTHKENATQTKRKRVNWADLIIFSVIKMTSHIIF